MSKAGIGQLADVPGSRRRKTRAALGFCALAGVCLLIAGLLAGQVSAVVVGALNLVFLVGYLLIFRHHGTL